jgi:hypothetical protein
MYGNCAFEWDCVTWRRELPPPGTYVIEERFLALDPPQTPGPEPWEPPPEMSQA